MSGGDWDLPKSTQGGVVSTSVSQFFDKDVCSDLRNHRIGKGFPQTFSQPGSQSVVQEPFEGDEENVPSQGDKQLQQKIANLQQQLAQIDAK
uniref:Uncharacterized protein n=1 Tax=Chromera velia CCMP2878 TaxID=1169474 RepID=A0A0G4FM94_9ALVE|eukprot:Cvel_17674.t1-p1 / transcript=Cvel_17674.t1 / gene=Cvel_17674 / organism=Chromera_velia_CCMP2878 / gene_product=hypothetical protein / transcript_product=hypothetical protein / location=Cvel_scaffold1424:42307-43269(+) / protein_length=91 / sequence_SO=supercontig / SO=protein_coding / is_pseudo=false